MASHSLWQACQALIASTQPTQQTQQKTQEPSPSFLPQQPAILSPPRASTKDGATIGTPNSRHHQRSRSSVTPPFIDSDTLFRSQAEQVLVPSDQQSTDSSFNLAELATAPESFRPSVHGDTPSASDQADRGHWPDIVSPMPTEREIPMIPEKAAHGGPDQSPSFEPYRLSSEARASATLNDSTPTLPNSPNLEVLNSARAVSEEAKEATGNPVSETQTPTGIARVSAATLALGSLADNVTGLGTPVLSLTGSGAATGSAQSPAVSVGPIVDTPTQFARTGQQAPDRPDAELPAADEALYAGPARTPTTISAKSIAQSIEDHVDARASVPANALLNLPPPPPCDLEVTSLTVGVPSHPYDRLFALLRGEFKKHADDAETHKRKTILNDVSIDCHSGEVLAILGGSGSGKTTLLNAVAYRMADLPVRNGGVAYVSRRDDRILSKSESKRRIGFVRQQDFLVECLTVRETLTYAARLRLPTSLSEEAKRLIVEQTLDELGLRDAADTVVGGPLRKGISGGEKRRLSIGCVLVTLPSVLILDEPTSGLDAFTSYLLLQTLNALARRGRTVIVSIHAPRSDAYPLFDRLVLLSKGRVVYSGLRRDCLPWFSELGHNVEPGVNPLDFLVDISSVDNRTPENEEISSARVRLLTDAWQEHVDEGGDSGTYPEKEKAKKRLRNGTLSEKPAAQGDRDGSNTQTSILTEKPVQSETQIATITDASRLDRTVSRETTNELERIVSTTSDPEAADPKRPGFFRQLFVLTSRAHISVYRNYPVMLGLVAQGVVLGIFIGLTFYKLKPDPTGIQSLKNLCFQLIPSVFYLQQVFWVYKFCSDLIIFDREREDRLYDVVPWVISDWVSYLAPAIFAPTIYVILVYFMADLRGDGVAGHLFTIIASTILVQWTTQGLALVAVSLTRTFALASLIANALNIFTLLSAGFVVVHVPVYVRWIRYVSPYFYSFRVIATTLFKGRVFDCPTDSLANLEQCDGNKVLASFRFDMTVNIGVWFAGLFGLALGEFIIACVILSIWNGGGVRHASEIDSHNRGKTSNVENSQITRDRIDVEVRNLSLSWRRRRRGLGQSSEKLILNNINLEFPSGQVSVILGPSGAGKSTLLQLLAQRKLKAGPFAGFYRSGEITYAGQPASARAWTNMSFVEQEDDWHLPTLTVRETLRYAAILRLPSNVPRKKKIARAETVLLMLGLKDCADLPVGGPLVKGISGGEKRRLSLAVQMINDPAVLVVDEPTSGLDAAIALSVMQVLCDIAATGRTVIATIHQPRSDIWRLADNVTLLARGGTVAFSGRRADAVPYFSGLGYPMPTEYFNPADHLLDLVSIDPRVGQETHNSSKARVQQLTSHWQEVGPKEDGDELNAVSTRHAPKGNSKGTTPMRIALPVVVQRHSKNLWRQKEAFLNRFLQAPLVAALFIIFFLRITHGPQGAQDRIGLVLETTSPIGFVAVLNAMAFLPAERNLYIHEASSSARYSPATFVLMYTLVEFPAEVVASLGFSAILNVGVGMQTSAKIYFEHASTIFCMLNMGESFALIVNAWVQSEGLTVTILSTFLSMIAQISGVISLSVPKWLSAIAWFTCMKAATRIQMINELIGLKFVCTKDDLTSGRCVATSGEQMLALFGWTDLSVPRYVGIMFATTIIWRLLAWLSMSGRVGGFR